MKRFAIFIFSIFICTFANGETLNLNWYVDNQIYQTTTCEIGVNVTPPTAPNKKGYTFQEWYFYTPIEYLESTGTQYIDTGVIANQDTRIIFDGMITYISSDRNNNFTAPFGSETSYNSNRFAIYLSYFQGGSNYARDYPGYGTQQREFATNIGVGDRFVVDANKNDWTLKINNNIKWNQLFTKQTFVTPTTVVIFAYRRINTIAADRYFGKVYSCKLYNNDILVRDFIPVLDSNGTPCMYDKVTKQFFYNQGTGQFIVGPVVTE